MRTNEEILSIIWQKKKVGDSSPTFHQSKIFPQSSHMIFFSNTVLLSLITLSFFFANVNGLKGFKLALYDVFVSPGINFSDVK